MSFGRIGRKLLVLAVGLASWGSLRAEVSPNLHIVANAVEGATKKLSGGFTTKLLWSAQAIGRELVQIVTRPTTRLAAKPANLKKSFASTRAQVFFAKIQANNDHNPHWNQQNNSVLSGALAIIRESNPNAGKNLGVESILHDDIGKSERFFPQCLLLPGTSCSLYAKNVITITKAILASRPSSAASASALRGRVGRTVAKQAPVGQQPSIAAGMRALVAIAPSIRAIDVAQSLCFSIDRAGRAACVAHGTVGARIALYSDRSRNDRA